MKQLNSQILQIKLRKKFLKSGVRMIGPETIFFSKDIKIGKKPFNTLSPKNITNPANFE